VGFPVKSLGRIIRSVQAFGREFSGRGRGSEATPDWPAIGLALGGGFARGIAHVGVLKVLEEENIPVSFVAGTSVGALIGAAYCSGVSVSELEELATRVRFKHFARWTLSRYGFASNQRMIGFLNSVLKVKSFEDLCVPLAVTATDFSTGEGVVFHSGPLVDPVRASCAYPGMFLPVKMGAERVLAVHLKGTWTNKDGPRHLFDVIGQCFAIAQEMNGGVWKRASDLVIEPDVNGFKYDDFEHSRDLVRAGELVTRAALPEIKKWLETEAAQRPATQKLNVRQPAAMPAD
jgi:NTE family protein